MWIANIISVQFETQLDKSTKMQKCVGLKFMK